MISDLINPKWDNGAAGTHHIAIAGATNLRLAAGTAPSNSHLLFQRLGGAHNIDGISRLIGGQTDNGLDASLNSSGQNIVCTDNIGAHSFHREEFAGRHLLERRCVKYIVYSAHSPT